MEKLKLYIIPILIICLLGFLFHRNNINELPSHTHAWAQADRYSLALQYADNGMNFFKPQTYTLNHQFPGNWLIPSNESITAVDFPIHDYVIALFMKITGSQSPWIFRLYILLYSFIGLFFLFKLAHLVTNSFWQSILVLFFAATSPLFAYYQGSFLPSIPSLANAIIGIYYYICYIKLKSNKQFNIAIFFLTLSALSRTTFVICLLSVLGFEILRILKQKSQLKPKILSVSLSTLIIIGYFLYNSYLRKHYGSIFLSSLLPAHNFSEAIELLIMTHDRWLFQYFSKSHYHLLIVVVLLFFILLITRKAQPADSRNDLGKLFLIMFPGYILFLFAMLYQFPSHDYYFLDTFYLPLLLLLIVCLSALPKFSTQKIVPLLLFLLVCLVSVPSVINVVHCLNTRRDSGSWDRVAISEKSYAEAPKLLDSLKIPKEAKILTLDFSAPNVPFMFIKRKGYTLTLPERKNIETVLTWDYNYAIVQKEYFLTDIYPIYPEVLNKLEKIGDNGNLVLFKKAKPNHTQSLSNLLGFSNSPPVMDIKMNFDTISPQQWDNVVLYPNNSYSGKNSAIMKKDMIFGPAYTIKNLTALEEKERILEFSAFFNPLQEGECEVCLSINTNGQTTYYKTARIREKIYNLNQWQKFNVIFQLPKINTKNYEIHIFISNIQKTELLTDNMEIKIY